MGREQSMAAIDAALNGESVTGEPIQSGDATEPSVAAPHAAPGVEAPTPIADNVDKGKKPKELTAEEKAAKAEKDAKDAEDKQRQDRIQGFHNTANKVSSVQGTLNTIGGIARNGAVALESVPTPGSIMFPLVVLLVFFLLLIPVNGHTRLVWLWLAITGNASILPDSQGDSGSANPAIDLSSSLASLSTSANTVNQTATTIGQGLTMGTFMTGVQDLS